MPYIPNNTPKKPWIAEREPFEHIKKSKFYNSQQWISIRNSFRYKEPLCRECLRHGKYTPMVDVDHIIPINPHNPWDYDGVKYGSPVSTSNLQSLCKQCNATPKRQQPPGA